MNTKFFSLCYLSLVYSSFCFSADWDVVNDGYWNDDANWTPPLFPNGVDAVANFPDTIFGTKTVSLGASTQDITIGTLTLSVPNLLNRINLVPGFSGNKLIFETSSGPATFTLSPSSEYGAYISAPVQLNSPLIISSTNGVTIFAGEISGNGGIEINSGTVNYEADNTYTGLTTIGPGALLSFENYTGYSFGGDLVCSGNIRFSSGDQVPHTAHMTFLDGTNGHMLSNLTMGRFDFLGGQFYNDDTFPDDGFILTGSGTALTMRNTDISFSLQLTGGGSIVFDSTNGGTATINHSLDLGGNPTTFDIANGTAEDDMSISATISNGGIIKTGAGLLNLTGANTYAGGTVINAGTLKGNSISLPGNITNNSNLVFDQQTTGTYSDQISGSGALVKQGIGALTFTNSNSLGNVAIDQGALIINGSLNGMGTLTAAAGTVLGGVGTVVKNCTINGTLAPGNSIGTLSLVGNQVLTTGAQLEIEVDSTTSDLVDVTGTFTIQPGTTLSVLIVPGTYAPLSSYNIINTTGGVTGTFSNTVYSSPLFTLIPEYFPLSVTLNLAQVPFSTLFSTGNAGAVAQCLDEISNSPCSNFSSVIESLETIPDENALKNALLQMQPSLFTSLAVIQENDLFYLREALYTRMEVDLHSCCLEKSAPSLTNRKTANSKTQAPPKEKTHSFWATLLGGHTSQDNQEGQIGFVANSPGVFLGLDSQLGKKSCFGGGMGYTYTHLHWWEKQGTADVQGIYGTLYGRFASDHAYVQGSLIGGYSFYSAERNILFGTTLPLKETAKNHHNGWEGSASTRIGLNYGCRFVFSPFIGVDYFYVHENSFQESGAKSLNLHVKSKNSNLLSSEIGIDLSRCFGSSPRTFSPFIKISAIRESRFKGSKEHASLECGCDMTVSGLYPSRTLAGVAAGFNVNLQTSLLMLSYQGKFGSYYNDNSWYLQYGIKF